MSEANMMRCTIHELRFEQPGSWYEKGMGDSGCLMCMADRLKAARDELDAVTKHRKVLLEAIDLKLTIRPDEVRND